MNEAKGEKCIMLVDTGATITLMKIKHLKGETLIYDEKVTLIGATGQTTDTLGVIKARIPLGNKLIKHKVHIVEDNFSIRHEGILGADFLQKYVTHWNYPKRQLTIEGTIFKLFPYKNFTLAPRSETIIQAIASQNTIGIVHALEAQPGVVIGNCLVEPRDSTCLVSVINITDKEVGYKLPT